MKLTDTCCCTVPSILAENGEMSDSLLHAQPDQSFEYSLVEYYGSSLAKTGIQKSPIKGNITNANTNLTHKPLHSSSWNDSVMTRYSGSVELAALQCSS